MPSICAASTGCRACSRSAANWRGSSQGRRLPYVGQQEVRLFGIDAPEFTQSCTRGGQAWACGSAAADQLAKLAAGKQVSCTPMGADKYGRTVARCTAGHTDLNGPWSRPAMRSPIAAIRWTTFPLRRAPSLPSVAFGAQHIRVARCQVRHSDDDHLVASPPQTQQSRGEMPVVVNPRSKRRTAAVAPSRATTRARAN